MFTCTHGYVGPCKNVVGPTALVGAWAFRPFICMTGGTLPLNLKHSPLLILLLCWGLQASFWGLYFYPESSNTIPFQFWNLEVPIPNSRVQIKVICWEFINEFAALTGVFSPSSFILWYSESFLSSQTSNTVNCCSRTSFEHWAEITLLPGATSLILVYCRIYEFLIFLFLNSLILFVVTVFSGSPTRIEQNISSFCIAGYLEP